MRFLFFFVGVGFFPFRIEIRAFSSFSKIEFSFVFLGLLSFPFIKSVGDFFGFAFDFSFGDSISRFIVGFGSIVGRIYKFSNQCNQINLRDEIKPRVLEYKRGRISCISYNHTILPIGCPFSSVEVFAWSCSALMSSS